MYEFMSVYVYVVEKIITWEMETNGHMMRHPVVANPFLHCQEKQGTSGQLLGDQLGVNISGVSRDILQR